MEPPARTGAFWGMCKVTKAFRAIKGAAMAVPYMGEALLYNYQAKKWEWELENAKNHQHQQGHHHQGHQDHQQGHKHHQLGCPVHKSVKNNQAESLECLGVHFTHSKLHTILFLMKLLYRQHKKCSKFAQLHKEHQQL